MYRDQVVSNHLRIQAQVKSRCEVVKELNQLDRCRKTRPRLRTMNPPSVVRRLPELKFPATSPRRNATRRLRNGANSRNGLRRLAVSLGVNHHQDRHDPIATNDRHVPNPNALNQHARNRRVPKRGLSLLARSPRALNHRVRNHGLNHLVRNLRAQNLVAIRTQDDQANQISRFANHSRYDRRSQPQRSWRDLPVVLRCIWTGYGYNDANVRRRK